MKMGMSVLRDEYVWAYMRSSPYGTLLVLVSFLLLLSFLVIREVFKPVDKCRRPGGKVWRLPPGPRGWPIIGNLLQLRQGSEAARELAKYGEMTTTHLGSKTWILLNSNRVITEIFAKRGRITNERPIMPVASGLISHDRRSVLLPTAQWTERRRLMHQLLTGTAVIGYGRLQELESIQLLAEYIYQPKDWHLHHGRFSTSVMHRIIFGKPVSRFSADVAALLGVVIDFITNLPPNNLIDCFPALAKLPHSLQWWRKWGTSVGKRTFDTYYKYWAPIRRAIDEGTCEACFARDVLVGEDSKFFGDDEDAMFLAGNVVEAGADTTRMTLNNFVLAAITYPEVLKKARAEVDAVCGTERLPLLTDEKNMPYICALIKELVRWKPAFVWSTEHTLTEDLEFDGYSFPAGVHFLINHHGQSFNPADYEAPEDFNPDRWIDGHEADILHGLWNFGGGRRVCVGYRLAQQALFINVARLVYCFDYNRLASMDISKTDKRSQAGPFDATATPRSSVHENLIIENARALGVLHYAQHHEQL